MIRITTRARIAGLEDQVGAAREQARQAIGAAGAVFGRHARELSAATGRAERAESAACEAGESLARTREELASVQQELQRTHAEICRLREELQGESLQGRALTLLLHYGRPHTIYASREDAHADTATHGVAPDGWVPSDERPLAAVRWRCEAFIYDTACNGFRRAFVPAPEPVGGAA
ncbi:hypothetical protein [Streptomyces sp. TRM68416]|uniref:hypothetical protein n=1 Tax=Streptomyces sp. TRM68416 TaxID=2758412 RepID=UPI001661E677|nr:hypothetical protein [Streptomyces sp. TRM68416]MBD0838858.1 hypothetical protein [Streptomyces sp. TRM68416]